MKFWQVKPSFFYLYVAIALLNVYMMFIPNTHESYSLFDKYEDYKPLNNWNLPVHAVGLIDNDNQEDLIEFEGCGFLTRANNLEIDDEKACEMVSQPLSGRLLFTPLAFPVGTYHSYLAKKVGEPWRIYEQVLFVPIIHEIHPNGSVKPVNSSIFHWIDAGWYMLTHLFTITPFI